MVTKKTEKKIRTVVYLTPDCIATLAELRQGESTSAIVRRAIRALAFGEAQVHREKVAACNVVRPVLISAK